MLGLGDDEAPVPLEVGDDKLPVPPEVADNEVPVIVVLVTEELLSDDAAL